MTTLTPEGLRRLLAAATLPWLADPENGRGIIAEPVYEDGRLVDCVDVAEFTDPAVAAAIVAAMNALPGLLRDTEALRALHVQFLKGNAEWSKRCEAAEAERDALKREVTRLQAGIKDDAEFSLAVEARLQSDAELWHGERDAALARVAELEVQMALQRERHPEDFWTQAEVDALERDADQLRKDLGL